MAHISREKISEIIFHERYAQVFRTDLRQKFGDIITGIVKKNGLYIQVNDRRESSLSLLTVSIFDPRLFAAYCAVLSTQDFDLTAIDLFTGNVKIEKKIRLKTSSINSLPEDIPVMVCEWHIKGENCFSDEDAVKNITDLLIQREHEFKGLSDLEKKIFADRITRNVFSYSDRFHPQWKKLNSSNQVVDRRESKIVVEKIFSPGYIYVFSLFLQYLDTSPLSLMYRKSGNTEIIELTSGETCSGQFKGNALHGRLAGLGRVLNICTDVVKSLAYAPDPVKALKRLFDLSDSVDEKVFDTLTENMKNSLIRDSVYRVVGSSDFLWEDFIKSNYVSFLDLISNSASDNKFVPDVNETKKRIKEICSSKGSFEEKYEMLNRFKDFVLFSIEINHLMGSRPDVGTLARQLTGLANLIIAAFVSQVDLELETKYGRPVAVNGKPVSYCVYGLGKLGGAALGFASDLELFFIYDGEGQSPGPDKMDSYEYFDRLVKRFLEVFQTKINGIFEPDMRLRPYGKKGNLATTLSDFNKYYSPEGASHALERIALYRAGLICGSAGLDRIICRLLTGFFKEPGYIRLDELSKARISGHRNLNSRSFNMKHGDGAIVDLETIIQLIQIQNDNGSGELWIREIYRALPALFKKGLLTGTQRKKLSDAYYFFRRCINGQRILCGVADNTTLGYDANPDLAPLARRAGYKRLGLLEESEQLLMDLRWHSSLIKAMGIAFFGENLMTDHSLTGMEDIYHRKEIPFRHVNDFINKKGTKVTSHFLAVFDEFFSMAEKSRYTRYLIIAAGDMILKMQEPEVACTRLVIILKQLLTGKNEIDRWIKFPDRLRLLITLISKSRTYFYLLRSNPELSELFFFSNRKAKEWYREYLIEQLSEIYSAPDEKPEILKKLRMLRQKLDFFIAVFTTDGTIKINESMNLLHSLKTKLITQHLYFLVKNSIAYTKQKYNPEHPGFAVCISMPQRISIIPFGTLYVFLVYEDWYVKEFDKTVQEKTKSYYTGLLKNLCDDLSTVSKDGHVMNLSPFNTIYKTEAVFTVSDIITDRDAAYAINVSSTLTGENSLLPRLKRKQTPAGNRAKNPEYIATVSDIMADHISKKCYSCPDNKNGTCSTDECDMDNLLEYLYVHGIAMGENISPLPVESFSELSAKPGRISFK